MSDVVIRAEDLWKEYRLGVVSHAFLEIDLECWWDGCGVNNSKTGL